MHLTLEQLRRWRDEGRAGDRNQVVEHLSVCDPCGRRCTELLRTRPPNPRARRLVDRLYAFRGRRLFPVAVGRRTSRPRRFLAPATLALAMALAWVLVAIRPTPERPLQEPSVNDVRGAALQAVSPTGPVDGPLSFTWASPYAGLRYRLDVFDPNGRLIYSTTVQQESVDAPPALNATLAPSAIYSWTVTALDADGAAVAASPAQAFSPR